MSPADQDAKVRFRAPPHQVPGLREAVLAVIRARLGWPEIAAHQAEIVEVRQLVPAGHGWRVHFTYTFDHDTASQFDMADRFVGDLVLDERGACTASVLDGA